MPVAKVRLAALVAVAVCVTTPSWAQTARTLVRPTRHALVVGNDTYAQAALQNARNDARAIAKALGELDFRVTLLEDATHARFSQALDTLAGSLQPTDVALVYFAGHGVEVEGQNYLVPVDYRGVTPDSLKFTGINVGAVAQLVSRAKVSVVILDACRNNPFKGQRTVGGGLAPMEAVGTLIAYATGAGQTASDNPGASNGLFTQQLLLTLKESGLGIGDIFRRVRQQVYTASNRQQFPAVYDSLIGDLVLRPASGALVAVARQQFETLLNTYDRDTRVELRQAFDQLEQGGVATANDKARLDYAIAGSLSAWMSSANYQAEFERQMPQGFLAAPSEGRLNAGRSEFRAVFRRLPRGTIAWDCRHGLTKEAYETRHSLLVGQGYRRLAVQTFTDASGVVRYQATWIRTR